LEVVQIEEKINDCAQIVLESSNSNFET